MVMPLPSHLRMPSTDAPSTNAHPRSPIKKHLRGVTAASPIGSTISPTPKPTSKLGSPQKLKATVASQCIPPRYTVPVNGDSSMDASRAMPSASSSGVGAGVTNHNASRLRAATLQAVLGLVDRDDDALQQLLPMLHALAALPLDSERVRRQLGMALQELHATATKLPNRPATSTTTSPLSSAAADRRDSGRAKSSVSLRHCKAFLLACANEIHELEEVNPCFDYAEETGSEMAAVLARSGTGHGSGVTTLLPMKKEKAGRRSPCSCDAYDAAFDYASLVDSHSSIHTRRGETHDHDDHSHSHNDDDDDDDDDDARADTGSQFSELLFRTVEVEKADREAAVANVATCRRVFCAWRGSVSRQRNATETATMARVFAALKTHRAGSTRSLQRKQRAFGRMKQLLRVRPAPSSPFTSSSLPTPTATRSRFVPEPSLTARVLTRMLVHWDLVVLLAVACFVQLVRLQ